MSKITIGIIGGSGLYHMDGLTDIKARHLSTPMGNPSDAIITGTLQGVAVAFLARHGRSHSLLPSEVPYRANILAMKQLGVKYLLSFSAVGSLKETLHPRDMVIPDQYIDLTKNREMSFFGKGAVAHVSMAQPICPELSELLSQAVKLEGKDISLHRGGTYVCIEGPHFSSLAESNWYRSMGASVIGMTNMPEAKLAKEAQIAYTSLAMVTDYDCWHPHEENVSADAAFANLKENARRAENIAREAIRLIAEKSPLSPAHTALSQALVTPLDSMPVEQRSIVQLLLH